MLSSPSTLLTISWLVYFASALHYFRTSWSTLYFPQFWLSLMPRRRKVEIQHDTGFQRWILTRGDFAGADNIIARMEHRHRRLFINQLSWFKSLSCAEQLALRSHASNAVRGIAWPRSFSRDLLQAGVQPPLSIWWSVRLGLTQVYCSFSSAHTGCGHRLGE